MLYCVIAAYNNMAYTMRLCEALAATDGDVTRTRLVVIDNGSDGTGEVIKSRFGRGAIVFDYDRNIGVSAAWNAGIRCALDGGATAILVAGNDTIPAKGTVERLYRSIASGVLFVTGSAVSYPQSAEALSKMEVVSAPPAEYLAAPDFSFFMLTPQCIQRVGSGDANRDFEIRKQLPANTQPPAMCMNPWEWGLFGSRYYPSYFEDNDYHARAWLSGVELLRDEGALFGHECSLAIRTDEQLRQRNNDTFRRNGELFAAKWGAMPQDLPMVGAKPLNVSDEQYAAMTGGKPVRRIDAATVKEQAKQVYAGRVG